METAVKTATDTEETDGNCLVSPGGQKYLIGAPLGRSEQANLYECHPAGSERPLILKIAANVTQNPSLDREAYVLKLMAQRAQKLEARAIEADASKKKARADSEPENKEAGRKPLNYQYFFPELVDSFLAQSQENRRVNIFGFPPAVEKLPQLVPISGLTEQEQVCVDPRTAAWILGKTLKVLGFAHGQGITNGMINATNIIIEREMHGLIIMNWSEAKLHTGKFGAGRRVPTEFARQDLMSAGYAITILLGGDPSTGQLIPSEQLPDDRFEKFIRQLTIGAIIDAEQAHHDFYELIWNLWLRGFHPFTALPIKNSAREEE